MPNLSFEDKIRLLIKTPPGKKKQELINKFSSDPTFASKFYVDAMTLDKYMEVNRERFRPYAEEAAKLRGEMKNKGWTDSKNQRLVGHMPPELFHERQEFHSSLPKEKFTANVRAFLTKYPAFRLY